MRVHAGMLLAATLAGAGMVLAAPATAQITVVVTDGPSLRNAITTGDNNGSPSYIIQFVNNITLSSAASNTLAAFNTTSAVTVNGNGFTLDGGGVQRGLFVFSGNVAINNLTIQNTQALGGTDSSGQGGGGGAGLGGALFVASGGNVTAAAFATSDFGTDRRRHCLTQTHLRAWHGLTQFAIRIA